MRPCAFGTQRLIPRSEVMTATDMRELDLMSVTDILGRNMPDSMRGG